ncbi:hypothetical protein OJF2_70540 [Aquisphaera giovannonii]|uniref:Uncharacterized protein n=1 Tax=Aquisphaera giovannonii TaxID=406548 RepID=A0A5B9WET1_9BACT|nr:hypothetical protein [Aquisphaera giovannonii]QEH38451.1 hypothetical protein OJF2_70540 [Aquisphaera giovannonii]
MALPLTVDLERDRDNLDAAYLQPVRIYLKRKFQLKDDEIDEVTQDFFATKILDPGFLARVRQAPVPRAYLLRSLANHVWDKHFRGERSRRDRTIPLGDLEPAASGALQQESDTIYALCVLHTALQQMRVHCESSGKVHWALFRDLIVDVALGRASDRPDEEVDASRTDGDRGRAVRGRPARTREQIAEDYARKHPGMPWSAESISWRLARARLMFVELIKQLIPPALGEGLTADDRYDEWLDLLQGVLVGRSELLPLAFRVTPHPQGGTDVDSMNLVGTSQAPELTEDELRVLMDFRLALPLEAFLGEIAPRREWTDTRGRDLTLRALVEAPPALPPDAWVGLLNQIRSAAKAHHASPDHGVPAQISRVVYNLTVALALVRCDSRIARLRDDQLRGNFRQMLAYPWLTPSLRPVFEAALHRLDGR